MKKNIIICTLIILILAGVILISVKPEVASVEKYHYGISLSESLDITCTYSQIMHASFQDGKIKQELPTPENNPIIMTYSDLNKDVSKIKFIDSTRTISEVSAVTVSKTDDKIVLIEGNGDPYMTMHTLYIKSGVAIYAKEISLVGIPVGSMSMGSCINS